ncbi:MAG: small multi-drug export protein [Clostridia bacterium]|nr:small multi-drug export protein [Clostridia bacterium]MBQ2255761.1 small multi-drug export protein [Clostridia bacterium]MBQ5793880.1 small multi-drug export protein [Clostridia bacterium]
MSGGKELGIFLCSMVPVIELRGAIPLGWATETPWWLTYLLAVAGNMLPVPFILLLIRQVLTWMEKLPIKFVRAFAAWLRRKAEKNTDKIQRFGFWGLCFFIAIPLPVTGAWTGSLVAATIHMKFWRAMLSALLGVMIAGVIVTLICFGVSSGIEWLSFLI